MIRVGRQLEKYVCRTWPSSILGDVLEFSKGHNKIMENIIRKPNYKPYVTGPTVNEKTWIKVTKKGDR